MNPPSMPIRTRFAPSPTGRLHLGHALAARVAHDLVRSADGGRFLLRFEDIDAPRVRDEFYQEIEKDLQWLGLPWDEDPLRQTNRSAAYDAALDILREPDLIYPCFCTRREIQAEWAAMSGAPQGPEGPIYPGTCLRLAKSEREDKIAAGIPHAWRLDSHKAAAITGPLTFHDLRFGTIAVNPNLLGDVILTRKDINPHFPALQSSPRLRQAGRSDPMALSGACRRKQTPSSGPWKASAIPKPLPNTRLPTDWESGLRLFSSCP